MRSKICQSLVYRDDHRGKFLEVLVVGCPFFRLAPEVFNWSKDFVAFALATGGNLRLLATTRPRVTQGAPLRKTGLIFKQNQPLAPLGRSDNRRPLLLQPGEALRCIEMIRHKPSLLKRKPQVAE